MKRRDLLIMSAATLTLSGTAAAAADGWTDASPDDVLLALSRGETVFVDFAADWCTTCRAQERVINALLEENPAYGEAVNFMRLDWDKHGRSELAQVLNVPRRSTLIVLKGEREYGRIVAGTQRGAIKELMDTALQTAQSS